MTSYHAFQAAARFGLGAREGEVSRIGNDPRGWVIEQLKAPHIPEEVKQRYGGTELLGGSLRSLRAGKNEAIESAVPRLKDIYINETGARLLAQVRSDQPFIERMVLFWSNHFTVSMQKALLAAVVNQYEVEAIRPHVNGYFKDMLLAVCQHPAMLFYLDNVQSFGANSPAGKRRDKGLNENLAREIMELHTLGVSGGYTQEDVIALANIITGWTLDRDSDALAYKFQPLAHEPGSKTLLGHRFAEDGEQEGIDTLSMLATHPATARHIATKLVRHFVQDAPMEYAVQEVANAFIRTGGHLPSVIYALVNINEAWSAPLTKLKNPYEYVVSSLRLTGVEPTATQAVRGLEALNFRAFNAPSPAGYDDVAESWASSDAILKRIEWGQRLAQSLPAETNPMQLADAGLGDLLSSNTRQVIERAASGADGVALLLASPEFQRR